MSRYLGLLMVVVGYFLSQPSPINPEELLFPSLPSLEPNSKLSEALHLQNLPGPESFALDSERFLYTGLANGTVMRSALPIPQDPEISFFSKLQMEPFLQIGELKENCGTYETEPGCGRPLGMEFNPSTNELFVVDAYAGLLAIHVGSKERRALCPSTSPDLPLTLPNDVTIHHGSGVAYFTDSSSHFQRRDIALEALEAGFGGRLLAYFPENQTCAELASGLRFPNGITQTHDGRGLLINSYTTSAVLRFDLETRAIEDFAIDLPGHPDNLKPRRNGLTYLVALGAKRAKPFSLLHYFGDEITIRILIAKLVPSWALVSLIPKFGLLAEIDAEGKLISTYQDPTGRTPWISDVFEFDNGVTLLGSWFNPFIAVENLAKK